MKTFKFSLVLRTRENTDVFIILDDYIYGIHSKRVNILYLFIILHIYMGDRYIGSFTVPMSLSSKSESLNVASLTWLDGYSYSFASWVSCVCNPPYYGNNFHHYPTYPGLSISSK